MNIWLFVSGVFLVLAALLDGFISTLTTTGSGPVTGRVATGIWWLAMLIHRRRTSHRLLQVAGITTLLAVAFTLILMLWAGWTLIFSSADEMIVSTATGFAASLVERIYFTGYTIFTLGNGEYQPSGGGAQIATVLANLSGLFLVTLAITYLIPIVSAVTQMRQMALSIKGIGETPAGTLIHGWDGASFDELKRSMSSLAQSITLHGQRHLAYPLLHYYHGTNPSTAPAVRIAALDEALTLLQFGVAPEHRLPDVFMRTVRVGVTSYLDTVATMYIRPADHAPPPPSLEPLRAHGIPVVDADAFARAVAHLEDRRKLLLSSVTSSGWTWDDVTRPSEPSPLWGKADSSG